MIMKTIIKAWIIVMITGLSSCIVDNVGPEGPMGLQGPQGNDGPKGDKGESGFVFEYEQLNFTAPKYELFLPFPDDFETLSSDVALVYLFWGLEEVDGVPTDIWRQIPQTILTNDGILQYNFDFSLGDVRLFMEAEFDLAILGATDTDDWVARVVIVPGDFWNSARMASGELPYNEIKEMLGLPELTIPNSVIKRRQ